MSAVTRSISSIRIEREAVVVVGGVPESLLMEYEREKESGVTCGKGILHDRVRDEEVGCDTVNISGEGEKSGEKGVDNFKSDHISVTSLFLSLS